MDYSNDSTDIGYRLVVSGAVFAVVVLALFTLRLVAQRLAQRRPGFDDYFLWAALLTFFAFDAICIGSSPSSFFIHFSLAQISFMKPESLIEVCSAPQRRRDWTPRSKPPQYRQLVYIPRSFWLSNRRFGALRILLHLRQNLDPGLIPSNLH